MFLQNLPFVAQKRLQQNQSKVTLHWYVVQIWGGFVNEMLKIYPLEVGRSTVSTLFSVDSSFENFVKKVVFCFALFWWGLNPGITQLYSPALLKFYVETGSC